MATEEYEHLRQSIDRHLAESNRLRLEAGKIEFRADNMAHDSIDEERLRQEASRIYQAAAVSQQIADEMREKYMKAQLALIEERKREQEQRDRDMGRDLDGPGGRSR